MNTAVVSAWRINSSRFFGNGAGEFATKETIWDGAGNIQYSSDAPVTRMGLGAGECALWPHPAATLPNVGAKVLYRYQDGVLTNQPLWNRGTGQFPCGAVIPNANDMAGSCFDVHKRLHVNTNDCAFPAGY